MLLMRGSARLVAFVVPGILSAIGLLLFLIGGWLWLRAPLKNLCPGPHLHWLTRLMPLWLVYRPRCAYDLSGHAPDAHGAVRCPECGREVVRRSHMVRTPRAWKLVNLGCAFIAAGALVYRYPPLAATTVVQYTPTNLLLRGEGFLGVGTPMEVRSEIRRRAMDHQLDDSQVCRFVRLLVNDLRDDALVENAESALEQLAIFGLFCVTPLVEVVESDDPQQRRLAVEILQALPAEGEAPQSLLRASIADLRSDQRLYNGKRSFLFLITHATEAEALLAEAMAGDDAQQRLLCAAVAGCAGREALMAQATPILVSHLANNQVAGDAIVAARAMHGFGESVLPLLGAYRQSADPQQRQTVEYIVRRMTTNQSLADLQRELPLARLTRAAQDALSLEPEYLDMPEF
jgi:hypothetical protein